MLPNMEVPGACELKIVAGVVVVVVTVAAVDAAVTGFPNNDVAAAAVDPGRVNENDAAVLVAAVFAAVAVTTAAFAVPAVAASGFSATAAPNAEGPGLPNSCLAALVALVIPGVTALVELPNNGMLAPAAARLDATVPAVDISAPAAGPASAAASPELVTWESETEARTKLTT